MFSMLLYFKCYMSLHSKNSLFTLKNYFLEQFLEKRILKPCHIGKWILCNNSWLSSAINCCQKELHSRSDMIPGSSSDCDWLSPYNFVKVLCFCLYYYVKLCIWFVWIYTVHLCFPLLICCKLTWGLPGVKSWWILNGRLLIKFWLKGVLRGLPRKLCIKFMP